MLERDTPKPNLFICWTWIFALLVIGLSGEFAFGQDQTAAEAQKQAEVDEAAKKKGALLFQADRCKKILRESIYDFYMPSSVDKQNGGYFETLGEDGEFVAGKEQFLTFQARQIWFFSHMAVNKVDRLSAAQAAEHGYGCLQNRFFDSENGGCFLKILTDKATTDDKRISDDRKHVYPLSSVIYALVEMHRSTDSERPLKEAMDVFKHLEEKCYDQTNGGYYELFTRDWEKVTDSEQWGVVGAVGFKTYNSHLHLLEAFTQLYLETKNELVGKRLEELIEICTKKVRCRDLNTNVDSWTVQWKLVESDKNLRTSYGHDLECAWLVREAAIALGKHDQQLDQWAISICDNAIKFGHDAKNGGFFYTGPVGKPSDDRKKEWWTQSEALVGLLTCYEISNDEKYLKLFNKTLDFIESHHVSERGGWYASLKEDGSLGPNQSRSSMWQGAYHNGRAMKMCESKLRWLANPGPDFSDVDSMEKAKKLVADGKLDKLYLLPIEFGGKDIPANTLYIPVGLAKVKAHIDINIIGNLVKSGAVTQYSAEPEYSGHSVIPTRIRIRAWNPRKFKTRIDIWGDALRK